MKFEQFSAVSRLIGKVLPRRGFLGSVFGGAILAGGTPLAQGATAASAAPTGVTFSRISLCVSDLERSVDFYRQAFGFEEVGQVQSLGKALETAFQTDADLTVRFIRRDGITLELLHFEPSLKPAPHPIYQPGLANLTIVVDDVDKIAARIRQHGGAIFEKTRMRFGAAPQGADILICADPDGVKIGLEALLRA